MSSLITALTLIIGSYFVGSIPTGLLVGLYGYGVDIRKRGSGNIGSTNTLRTLGPAAAVIVLAGDIAKGMTAVLVTNLFFTGAPTLISRPAAVTGLDTLVVVLAAMAALLGNNFSIYLRFHGGKGIGIASGIILAMTPVIALILLFIWLVVVFATRYVSLGSITIAITYPLLMYLLYHQVMFYIIFSLAAAALAIFRHRANIARLYRGEELRLGEDSKERRL